MTLNPYTPDRLDKFALRLFDLAAELRTISRQARSREMVQIPVHDRKAIQWCENLEVWVRKTNLGFKIALEKVKADHQTDQLDQLDQLDQIDQNDE